MSYRKYGDYREPVGSWLGEIPSSWEIQRVKAALLLRKTSVGRFASKHVLLSLTLKGVIERDLGGGGKFPADFSTYQLVELDDLVFCLFDIDETPRTVGIARGDGMITGAYSVYRCRGANVPHFLSYYFLHLDSFKGLRPFYTGLRKVVRADTFSKIEIPLPSVDEQRNIAAFLDHETARIDALIEKQQQLIALLKEKRQAVISHAVTKGLDPGAALRDSGVDWHGKVPRHWINSKLGYRYTVDLGKMLDSRRTSGRYLGSYLRNTDVQWDRINEDGLPQMDFHPNERARYSARKGDLLVCEGGEVGRCAIWENDYDCYYQKALHRLRPKLPTQDYPRFMFYCLVLAAAQGRFVAGSEKATIAHLPAESFRQYTFVFPPADEQRSIAHRLDQESEKFDVLEATVLRQLKLLRERRSAVISAAVTGKIDVRGWTTPVAEAVVA